MPFRMGVTMANNPGMSLDEIVDYACLAEQLDFEAFWLTEDNIRDAFVTLDRIVRATERVLVGTGLTSIYARTPATLAMSSATLQNYSGGRFFLTVGTGGIGFVSRGHGITIERPVVRMREAVEIIRPLLRGERVTYEGEFHRMDNFHIREPASSHVPVYLGGLNPKMTRLAGEIGDGVLANFLTVERCEEHVKPWLAEGRATGNRTDAEPLIATLALTPPDTDGSDAAEALLPLRRRLAFYGASPHYRAVLDDAGYAEQADAISKAWLAGDQAGAVDIVSTEMTEKLTLAGSDEKLAAHLEAYTAAGIYPVIYPVPRKHQMAADFRSAITRVARVARDAGLDNRSLLAQEGRHS
jgi:alkanesulfonate monooxygenase SsuD/methylene tetrahydromethanopterin reductase-like flavin-dependent oxidoreductase (luciferase family)